MADKSPIEEIAEIISGNDPNVMELVKSCVYNAAVYFKDNTSRYEEHGMYIDDPDSYEEDEIPWIGMNDILEDNGYVYGIDSSSYLEDYIYAIESCKAFGLNGLFIDEEWFDEENEMQNWFEVLDGKWASQGFCIADIDFGGDDYLLFPCPVNILEKLDSLAQKAGYSIDYAKNM